MIPASSLGLSEPSNDVFRFGRGKNLDKGRNCDTMNISRSEIWYDILFEKVEIDEMYVVFDEHLKFGCKAWWTSNARCFPLAKLLNERLRFLRHPTVLLVHKGVRPPPLLSSCRYIYFIYLYKYVYRFLERHTNWFIYDVDIYTYIYKFYIYIYIHTIYVAPFFVSHNKQ